MATTTSRPEMVTEARQAAAVLVARLDAVHPALFGPAVLLLVLILAAVAAAAVVLLAAVVVAGAATGAVLCLRRALIAAAGFEGRKKHEIEPETAGGAE
ncbi:hypothetical protein [Streptomyces sp. URMC 129]|uniref:hypothetical protein n=1 Tax=Streptomyces sp. URMC 129 TaxID=3423407 RepID=UPI003F1D779C